VLDAGVPSPLGAGRLRRSASDGSCGSDGVNDGGDGDDIVVRDKK
jgi:hypothetical protein